MCDKCQQLETDILRYRKRLEQSVDPLTIEVQRTRKLLALGLDPLTIEQIDGIIRKLVQHEPAYAPTPKRFPLGTGIRFPLRSGRRHLARVTTSGSPARAIPPARTERRGVGHASARCIGQSGQQVPTKCERGFSELGLQPRSALTAPSDDTLLID